MSIRRVPLYEFMPYGAPELIESSSRFLARAVLTGALVWSAAFAVLAVGGFLRVAPVQVVRQVRVFDFTPPPLVPKVSVPASRPAPTPGPAVPTRPAAVPVDPSAIPVVGDEETRAGSSPPSIPGTGIKEPVGPVILEDDRTYQQYEVEQLPEVLTAPRPAYPSFAREAQVEGRVMVRVLVDRDGRVARVEVAQSIPLLDQAAIEAARNWRFAPARVAGRAVAVWVLIPFHFRLH